MGNSPVPIKTLFPHNLGWLRRPELDKANIQVWEKPSGELHAHDPRQGQLILQYYKMPPMKFWASPDAHKKESK